MRPWGKNRNDAMAFLEENPGATVREISKGTGIPSKTLYTLMSRMKNTAVKGYLVLKISQQPDMHRWLRRTCPEGVPLSDYVSSILVDAMHEDADE